MRTLPLQPPVASIESLLNLLGMTNNLLTIPGYRIIEQIYNGSQEHRFIEDFLSQTKK